MYRVVVAESKRLLLNKRMLGTQMYPSSRVISTTCSMESGDDEMSVLPRHTKVIVTGNNRTKSVLVGLQGVVKKAVGLGGWHWLVLKNGIEVKLQRNALSVLEPPTGKEDDSHFDFDETISTVAAEFSKFTKPRIRYAKHRVSAVSTKSMRHNSCIKVKYDAEIPQLGMNLRKLGTESLWRYCHSFRLVSIHSNLTKEQLVSIIQPHLYSQHVDEVQVIGEFIQAAKRLRKNS